MKTTQENAGKKYELLCYTRKPEEDSIYSEKLAYSMHLALREDGGSFVRLCNICFRNSAIIRHL